MLHSGNQAVKGAPMMQRLPPYTDRRLTMQDQTPAVAWRMPEDLKEQVKKEAAHRDRSFSYMLNHYVKLGLSSEKLKTEKASSPLE